MRLDILVPADVAREWGCSERHVRNMISRGQLGHFRLGGKLLRIPRAAVEEAESAFIMAATTAVPNPAEPQTGETVSARDSTSAAVSRIRLAAIRRRAARQL